MREFEKFPAGARSVCLGALTLAAEGAKADIVKGEAYCVAFAVQLGVDIWVLHAFQK